MLVHAPPLLQDDRRRAVLAGGHGQVAGGRCRRAGRELDVGHVWLLGSVTVDWGPAWRPALAVAAAAKYSHGSAAPRARRRRVHVRRVGIRRTSPGYRVARRCAATPPPRTTKGNAMDAVNHQFRLAARPGRPSQAERLELRRGAGPRAGRRRGAGQDRVRVAGPGDARLDERGALLHPAGGHRRGDARVRRRRGDRLATTPTWPSASTSAGCWACRSTRSRTAKAWSRWTRRSRRCRCTWARSACPA